MFLSQNRKYFGEKLTKNICLPHGNFDIYINSAALGKTNLLTTLSEYFCLMFFIYLNSFEIISLKKTCTEIKVDCDCNL